MCRIVGCKNWSAASFGLCGAHWMQKKRGAKVFLPLRAVRRANGYSGTPEYKTVWSHHYWIFNCSDKAKTTYKNMPFHKAWNPLLGGALWKGAQWILNTLGKRPSKDWSLDVINHDKGFVPGNLRWAHQTTQIRNRKHRTLGRFSLTELMVEARRHGYVLTKIKSKGKPQ